MNKYQKAKSKIVKITIKACDLNGCGMCDGVYSHVKRDLNEFVADRSKFHNIDKFKYVLHQKEICKMQYMQDIEKARTRG